MASRTEVVEAKCGNRYLVVVGSGSPDMQIRVYRENSLTRNGSLKSGARPIYEMWDTDRSDKEEVIESIMDLLEKGELS